MSTAGDENELPEVDHSDRDDDAGAESTPAEGEPPRDGASLPGYAEPQPHGSHHDGPGAPAQAEQGAPAEPGSPAAPEPSHRAEGIGVIDDDPNGGASSDAAAAASAHHHGQDEGRETLTAGEAQRAMSGEQEQRLPAMSQNNASEVEKVSGIVAQTRQDAGTAERGQVLHILRQRLEQSGIDLPDAAIEELADQITVGD